MCVNILFLTERNQPVRPTNVTRHNANLTHDMMNIHGRNPTTIATTSYITENYTTNF